MNTPPMTVRLPPEEARALADVAAARGMTRSDLVRDTLRNLLRAEAAILEDAPAA